jgi:hypothetical protein
MLYSGTYRHRRVSRKNKGSIEFVIHVINILKYMGTVVTVYRNDVGNIYFKW